jgi:hypothetical protein
MLKFSWTREFRKWEVWPADGRRFSQMGEARRGTQLRDERHTADVAAHALIIQLRMAF